MVQTPPSTPPRVLPQHEPVTKDGMLAPEASANGMGSDSNGPPGNEAGGRSHCALTASGKMEVLLCGGGHAVHVLTALIGHRENVTLKILSLTQAENIKYGLSHSNHCGSIHCTNDIQLPDYWGHPDVISSNPAEVVPNSDLIILSVPAFVHEPFLRRITPFLSLERCPAIGAMPGQSGFDLCCRDVLGDMFEKVCVWEMETLPWACRTTVVGAEAQVLGTKKLVSLAVTPPERLDEIADVLQDFIGPLPVLATCGSFLSPTIQNMNAIVHPSMMFGRFAEWDGAPIEEAPLFYEDVDERQEATMWAAHGDVKKLAQALLDRYPGLCLPTVMEPDHWMLRAYGHDVILDSSTLRMIFRSHTGYKGLRHPMVPHPSGRGFAPNFQSRYLTEDIPEGLVTIKGIALLANVETPVIDKLILWSQEKIGKEYLTDGLLIGRNAAEARTPQRYGFTDLDAFMYAYRYVPHPSNDRKHTIAGKDMAATERGHGPLRLIGA